MKIFIELETKGAAFAENFYGALTYVLDQLPEKVLEQKQRDPRTLCTSPEAADKLLDVNRNTVGRLWVEVKPPLVCSRCDTKHDPEEYENGDVCSHCGEELEE